jgi:hypothetical protein
MVSQFNLKLDTCKVSQVLKIPVSMVYSQDIKSLKAESRIIIYCIHRIFSELGKLIDRFGNIVGKKCYKKYMDFEEPCSFCPMVKALENKKLERAARK